MSLLLLKRNPLTASVLSLIMSRRAELFARHILRFACGGETLLDIGSGPGFLADALRSCGIRVTPLDVTNISFVEAARPVLYNGRDIPFPDVSFDVALLSTVLHHAHDPGRVVAEAGRVARRLVVIEDMFAGAAQKLWIATMCSLTNLEFRGHPHGNRTDQGWRSLFDGAMLRVADTVSFSHGTIPLRIYHLVRRGAVQSAGTIPTGRTVETGQESA